MSEEKSSQKIPFNQYVGQNHIPDAPQDRFGNAQGNQYDLGQDGAFAGKKIVFLQLISSTSPIVNFSLAFAALAEKGFEVVLYDSTPPASELRERLREACQIWIISDLKEHLSQEHIALIKGAFEDGKGIYIWGDNEPLYVDANRVAQALIGVSMSGNVTGLQTVTIARGSGQPGFIQHQITTGLQQLFEGDSIATIGSAEGIAPLVRGSAGNVVTATYDRGGKRAIIDGGFTRLYDDLWDTAGTGRFVKNAAVWLANWERHNSTAPRSSEKSAAHAGPPPEKSIPVKKSRTSKLVLEGSGGKKMSMHIKTTLGKSGLAIFGGDSKFCSEPQFTLETKSNDWVVEHHPRAQNETLLNGKAVTSPTTLKNGDQLAVGREARGIIKLPLKVQIG